MGGGAARPRLLPEPGQSQAHACKWCHSTDRSDCVLSSAAPRRSDLSGKGGVGGHKTIPGSFAFPSLLRGHLTTTREQRVHILLARAPAANGPNGSDEVRPLPAFPRVQRHSGAVDVTARFLGWSTLPYATVQWLLRHQCRSYVLLCQNGSFPAGTPRQVF